LPVVLTPTWVTWWLPVIAYMAMLFGFSSLSTLPEPPGEFSYYDVHVAAYAGLAIVTVRALAKGILRSITWRVVLGAIVISALYGVSDEYHQRFVPGRDFDMFDMLADAVGSIVGASAVGAWSIIRRRSETRDAL
jgi:VanZ family protein